MKKLVTILIPHYKTLTLTKLCLRLLRKYTDSSQVRVIVIDNDSQDESCEYLQQVRWIDYLHRQSIPGETGPEAHARALNLGLDNVDTPYMLSIHTDTLIKRKGWLEFLLSEIQSQGNIAGVGSWKLENKNWIERAAKKVEFSWQRWYFKQIGKKNHRLAGIGNNTLYLRSHCALYDSRILQKHNCRFGTIETVGKRLHMQLTGLGYEMRFIDSVRLNHFMHHLNHATLFLNPELTIQSRKIKRGQRRIQKILKTLHYENILTDDSLDV